MDTGCICKSASVSSPHVADVDVNPIVWLLKQAYSVPLTDVKMRNGGAKHGRVVVNPLLCAEYISRNLTVLLTYLPVPTKVDLAIYET